MHATDFHLYQRLYALAKKGWLSSASTTTTTAAPSAPLVEPGVETDLLARARDHLTAQRWEAAEVAAGRALDLTSSPEAEEILFEARRRLIAVLRAELLEPPRVPTLRVLAPDVARLRLSSAEKYLLSRCNGARDLRQIAQVAPLSELEVLKAFKKFVENQVVELV